MQDELEYIDELTNNTVLFEEKFNQIENYYSFDSKDEIYEFIKEYPGIIILLDALKPYLEKDFSEGEYDLYVSYDPEIPDDVKLVLTINVSLNRFNNGVGDDIRALRRNIHPLKRKINLLRELLIMPGVLNV